MNIDILTLDTPNKNNRIYSTECVKEAIEKYGKGPMFGQLGLPSGTKVDLNSVSHMVTDMRVEDGKFVGTLKILDTPQGIILRQLLEGGITPSFRPRGLADIGSDGVVKNYQMLSVDLVSDAA